MRFSSFLALMLLTVPAIGSAEEIVNPAPGQIDPAEIVKQVPGMPERGTTKATVEAKLGKPNRKIPAVGEPPISRWVYEPFTVYFEHNRVLHSVKNRTVEDR